MLRLLFKVILWENLIGTMINLLWTFHFLQNNSGNKKITLLTAIQFLTLVSSLSNVYKAYIFYNFVIFMSLSEKLNVKLDCINFSEQTVTTYMFFI